MDGKGRYLNNLFVERLWRTVKYEEVYRKGTWYPTRARRDPLLSRPLPCPTE